MQAEDVLVETPRLLLRRFRAGDLDTFIAYRNDPEVARYQGWESCSDAEGRDFIAEQSSQPLFQPGTRTQIAVEARDSGVHVGDCALRIPGRDPRQAEI